MRSWRPCRQGCTDDQIRLCTGFSMGQRGWDTRINGGKTQKASCLGEWWEGGKQFTTQKAEQRVTQKEQLGQRLG